MGVGAIMGIGGALMGALNANSASNQSWQRQQQLMEIQAELNRRNAKFNTAQAKEMWNYTNFENQMKHIKEAGLSPGLIYGMGGQGYGHALHVQQLPWRRIQSRCFWMGCE